MTDLGFLPLGCRKASSLRSLLSVYCGTSSFLGRAYSLTWIPYSIDSSLIVLGRNPLIFALCRSCLSLSLATQLFCKQQARSFSPRSLGLKRSKWFVPCVTLSGSSSINSILWSVPGPCDRCLLLTIECFPDLAWSFHRRTISSNIRTKSFEKRTGVARFACIFGNQKEQV